MRCTGEEKPVIEIEWKGGACYQDGEERPVTEKERRGKERGEENLGVTCKPDGEEKRGEEQPVNEMERRKL